MTNNKKFAWSKPFFERIDRRGEPLPPAWKSTNKERIGFDERGQGVYESGRGRVAALAAIRLIEQASQKIAISSFLLADRALEDALLAAARRGVRVYVLLATESRLGREEPEGEFDKKVVELHKAMLTRLGGHVLFRSAPHFHAKVVLIDPETRPAGMLLTANLTTEALERNEELAVVLSTQEVDEASAYLRWAMWESAEHELLDPNDRLRTVRPLGKVPHPDATAAILATTSASCGILDEMLRLVNSASSRIVVSSFGWDTEHAVVRRLCDRAREGIEVTVIARLRPASMPALVSLAQAGAKVRGLKWLHAKAVWIDSGEGLVMSANLQADGLDQGFELGVRLAGSRASELLGRLTRWAESAPWELAVAPTVGEVKGMVMLWERGQFSEHEAKESVEVDLGTVTANSAHDLVAARPALPRAGALPRLAHELCCTWTVVAPLLAPKAKKLRHGAEPAYSLPVFREPGDRLVVAVRSQDELEPARALMKEVGAAAVVVAEGSAR